MGTFQSLGEVEGLLRDTLLWSRKCLSDRKLLYAQCANIGARSLWVVILIGCSVGMVLALQSAYQLRKFNGERFVGALVSLTIAKELGPVMTALLLAGRVGAAMAAELGTMKVSEEIDALRSLGIHPIRYLVVPRFLASVFMTPLLSVFAYVAGVLGGLFVCYSFADVLPRVYVEVVAQFTDVLDICSGLIKSVVFGAILSIAACYQGLKTVGGAQEVGKATTRAVVVAFVTILVSDYLLTKVLTWTPIG
jgi:phospholipid/cholesterol/gamma-HCH transport system permease protein